MSISILMLFLLHTYPFLIPVLAWVIAQGIKTIVLSFQKGFSWRWLIQGGSMPSGHSAICVSTLTVIGYYEGIGSSLFLLAFVMTCLFLYDAMNIRYEGGKHAQLLNQLFHKDSDRKPLQESLGHTPLEVLAGSLLGWMVAMGVLFFPIL